MYILSLEISENRLKKAISIFLYWDDFDGVITIHLLYSVPSFVHYTKCHNFVIVGCYFFVNNRNLSCSELCRRGLRRRVVGGVVFSLQTMRS